MHLHNDAYTKLNIHDLDPVYLNTKEHRRKNILALYVNCAVAFVLLRRCFIVVIITIIITIKTTITNVYYYNYLCITVVMMSPDSFAQA